MVRTTPGSRSARALLLAVMVWACPPAAMAQQLNPVYTDDSPVARETLTRVPEFVAAGNEAEAVRELQKLLDEQPDRLVAVAGQPDLFVSVRARVNADLLANRKLLGLYREAESARAAELLGAGQFEAVEQSRLLTAPGFEAALRVAQTRMESAQFDAALLALAQLEKHPERGDPARGRDAAALLRTLARYLDRPEVRELAARWAAESGLADGTAGAVEAPALLRVPRTSFTDPAGPLQTEGVPPRPLWTATLEPQPIPQDADEAAVRAQQNPEELGTNLWVLPTVVGDTVYVNDGTFVTARDRFTLQPRWSIRPVSEEGAIDPWAARRAGIAGRLVEDTCSVSVSGRTLVATLGLAQGGDREGDSGTFAIDTGSGRILWSANLARLDAQLEGASVRGPALIDGDTVILSARKTAQGRRIVSYYLVGLSLESGKLRWVRPIGSAGSIPWGRGEQRVHPAPLLHQGVVYCIDPLGVIGAVEAATGRVQWIRRAPVPAMGGGPVDLGAPWMWDTPVIDRDTVFMLAPDRSAAVALDRRTGAPLAQRAASGLGEPSYLLKVGNQLAAVGSQSVVFVPIDDLGQGAARRTRALPQPGIRGRVVVAGDRLLVPRTDGMAILNPSDAAGESPVVQLDRLGNALPLESQLLVVDSANIHSYLTWAVAQRLLRERITANPDDPEPAVTYADLAYRSQHPDQIAAAADEALAAIEKSPTSEANRAARQRLFRVLRDMIEASQASWGGEAGQGVARPVRREQPGRRVATRPPMSELPPLSLADMNAVLARMSRAAATPDERVSYLMALGRLRDAEGKPALAAEAYQGVLTDPLLAGAVWQTTSAGVRADIEATRRVRQLVMEKGPAAYAAFEAQAERELQGVGSGASAQALERVARQFPAAALTATAWARAADLHEAAGRKHASVAALREGLIVAETCRQAGQAMDPAMLGQLAGTLVVRLQKLDQLFAAAQLVARFKAQYPEVLLTENGTALDSQALARDLLGRLAAIQRFPRIGAEVKGEVQALQGWSVMAPRSREQTGRACEQVMMLSATDSKVALFGVAGGGGPEGAGHGGASSNLQMQWSREYKGRPPVLLRLEPDSVYLFWDRTDVGDGAVIERISAVGGDTRWRTEPFRSLFAADELFEKRLAMTRNLIETPVDGAQRLTDLVVAMDEQTIAVVERSGRAASFELESGRLLWSAVTPVSQVHDVDVGGGAVVIGGAAAPASDRAAIAGLTPIIAVFDARTGQTIHNLTDLAGAVRWVRVADRGERGAALIAGLAPEIDSFDLVRGKPNWSIAGGPAFGSLDAWVFGDRLFVLDEHRSLWLASVITGEISKQPLETYEHLVGSGPIEAVAAGPDRLFTAFTTDRGVCIFDALGRLVGIDAVQGNEADEGGLLPPSQGEGLFVTVETSPRHNDANQTVYNLHVLDGSTGMLKSSRQLALELPPKRIAILDGRVLITAGNNTLIYQAPEADR